MEGTTKIKIRVGDHEFEAEGPVGTVQAQFEAFKELISSVPRISVTPPFCTLLVVSFLLLPYLRRRWIVPCWSC
jgi:hypothetical protein